MMRQARLRSVAVPLCPCGSGGTYVLCCRQFHDTAPVPTAERLMRARYSAYVLCDTAYLLATWHPTTRPARLDTEVDARSIRWLGLEIRRHAETPDGAIVEFIARYRHRGRAVRLHEVSRFVREAGAWWYLDGSFPKAKKT